MHQDNPNGPVAELPKDDLEAAVQRGRLAIEWLKEVEKRARAAAERAAAVLAEFQSREMKE
jgi:hypothetical protein